MDHNYGVDTLITLFVECGAQTDEDTEPLSVWTDLTAEELENMTGAEIEATLQKAAEERAAGILSIGWNLVTKEAPAQNLKSSLMPPA